MIASVQFYDVVVFVHILTVVLAFGPTFAYPVMLAVAERNDPRALPVVGRAIATWDRIALYLIVLLIASGVYLVIDRWSFGDFYVTFGMAAIIVLAGLAGAYFGPKTRQLIEIAERDIAAAGTGEVRLSEEFQALSSKTSKVGTFAGILVILTIYMMTAKPFL